MCGRYQLALSVEDLQELLPGMEIRAELSPRWNVAPTQVLPIALREGDALVVEPARWGLVPHWAKDASIGSRMINARSETLAQKPSFREPLKSRRCLVPATAFYEWKAGEDGASKRPHLVRMPGAVPFAFAGLWDTWRSPEGPVRSFTIVTTHASDVVAPIHERMPVILPRDAHAAWLAPTPLPPDQLRTLLVPWAGAIDVVEVSTRVNSPRNDGPECAEPIASA